MRNKVLIVEDEFVVANDLKLMLEQAGYTINDIADSAEEADESLQNQKPDIVILDIQLKGKLSGIDFSKKLKTENIPFIYVSANSNQKILEEAKTTEPYGFLVKPIRKKDLLVMLDIALYRHNYSFESKLRREELLQKKLSEISNNNSTPRETLLEIARGIQSYIPFDLITIGSDLRYLRIGFDDYQFIGEKELITITGLKKADLPLVIENHYTDTFSVQSHMAFPVTVSNGQVVSYFFYSRRPGIYTNSHFLLLSRLKTWLTDLAEKIIYDKPSPAQIAYKKQNDVTKHAAFSSIIGNHHLLLSALDFAAQVAPYRTSVLIQGESGTGKEKVAEAIHSLSPRKNGPFIKVNCAAIPVTLIESELFGHEKGAFTGAIEKRKGRFEQADGGTIFLDEIGELPFDMQAKLLRVLQEKEIEQVGGNLPIKVNVRIIAATNRNLEKEVAEGKFRLDLYYRLNVFPITMPPLRERKTDIELLTLYFADRFCKEVNKPFSGIAPSMMEEMLAYNWPGNIRELENVVEQSIILNDGRSKLELKRHLVFTNKESGDKPAISTFESLQHVHKETEREYIISTLKKTNGRIRGVNGAAELLNVKPTTLESKITRLNIKKEDFS